jgi:amino acid permease
VGLAAALLQIAPWPHQLLHRLVPYLLVFIVQFWAGFAPEGYAEMTPPALVENFFEVYLVAPIIVLNYVGRKVWWRTKFVKLAEVDLKTGISGDVRRVACWCRWRR